VSAASGHQRGTRSALDLELPQKPEHENLAARDHLGRSRIDVQRFLRAFSVGHTKVTAEPLMAVAATPNVHPLKGATVFMPRIIRTLVLPVIAIVALAGPGVVAASTPQSASGTFTYTSVTINGFRIAGGNAILDLSAAVSYTGTFSGTSVLHGTLTFHANGKANFEDIETFTGTVNGVPGTATFNLRGTSEGPDNQATAIVIAATGELASLHGVLFEAGLHGSVGLYGTYSGMIELPNG